MQINKDLTELVDVGIISESTAENIRNYFLSKEKPQSNRLVIVFGILGAILVGLGIILILAHNWDNLSTFTKTILAFIPLLIGQGLCAFTIIKKTDRIVWRESSAVFLTFAVGASISLISQIYNISGDISSFIMTWALLCLPLVYLMKSSATSLLFIVGITYYACETNYFHYPHPENYHYWWLMVLILPFYINKLRLKINDNFVAFHNWLLPISLIIVLGTLANKAGNLMFIAYMSLFSAYYLLGSSDWFQSHKKINNGFKQLGIAGSFYLLLMLSFDSLWKDFRDDHYFDIIITFEIISIFLTTALALFLLIRKLKKSAINEVMPFDVSFLLFLLIFVFCINSFLAAVLINLMVLAIGILTIKSGSKKDHLGILNLGLLIITALIICRFFDTNISFVLRGILFILVGFGFFVTNYLMLKRRKTNEK